jgi:hypothetical protein
MTMFRTLRAVSLVTALVAGCGGATANQQNPFPDCPLPEGAGFTGRWGSNLGDMELSQDGNTVVGSWKDLPNHKTGHIEGTMRGCLLLFSWTQSDDMIPGMPRESTGRGVFRYILDPASGTGVPIHRFEGTWGYGNDLQGGGVWNGRKKREGG